MLPVQIRKRNGSIVPFDIQRIFLAIQRTTTEVIEKGEQLVEIPDDFVDILVDRVKQELEDNFQNEEQIPSVEDIQNLVEHKLSESGYIDIAKEFILYRAFRAQIRAENRINELQLINKNKFSVIKFDGSSQNFDIKKIKRVFKKACVGYEKECKFQPMFALFKTKISPDIHTKDIIPTLIATCVDLITVENIKWQNVAGRLYILGLYKKVSRSRGINPKRVYSIMNFKKHFDSYIEKELYYKDFYKYYTKQEINAAGDYIVGSRDFDYIYSTVLSFDKRYLLNRNGNVHELPQEMHMCIALFLAIPEDKDTRLEFAKKIYDAISTQKISLPTPTRLNARTNFSQLASCFKLNSDDDLRAIYHNLENIAQISKYGGGVGTYLGHIRSKGGSIRGVENTSGGVIPWVRVINDTACAVNQLGSRAGAVSPTLDIWHRDIYDFLELQTETGDIRTKAFDVFPAVSVPDLFMERAEHDMDWALFDPHEIFSIYGKRLEDHFNEEFEEFYLECEKNKHLKLSKKVSAKDLMKKILVSCVETGMPYLFFRDTVNKANPNKHAGSVYSTQLCTEICQNTKASSFVEETLEDGQVVLKYNPGDTVVCNLASINVAKVNTQEEIDDIIPTAMRILDNVITLNLYPIKEAEKTAQQYRSVGLGYMGVAEHLACNKLGYDSKDAREYIDGLFERFALATLQSSASLAKERGAYPLFKGSEWDKGIIFGRNASWYNKHSEHPQEWKALRKKIKEVGLRFAYHISPAPNTSTSVAMGTTAGVLPLYKKFFVETNGIAPIITVAPNLNGDNFWYYKEYSHMDMNDVIDMISVIYKWVDQSISFEWLINPAETSPKQLYDYYFKTWKAKIKTIYYLRSMSADTHAVCESCAG